MTVKPLPKSPAHAKVALDHDDHPQDAGFVVPEPDGVESGVPFDEPANNGAPAPAGPAARRAPESVQRAGSGGGSGRGLSIRHKLYLGLGVLTAIIAVLGAVSIGTLRDVNSLSVDLADHQARLARAAEEIATTVYLIRDAEKDFLLLEEQEALDRVTRYTARARTQLEKAALIVEGEHSAESDAVNAQFNAIAEAIDNYEARFAAQVKDVRGARASLEQRSTAGQSNRANLAGQIENGPECRGTQDARRDIRVDPRALRSATTC